jgi:pimeloyl-ACP methyl ester carboxylesterase
VWLPAGGPYILPRAEARSREELKIMEPRKLRRTRREILKNAALAAFAAPAIGQGRTKPQPGTAAKTATFVLVHGAWHGGWCWQRVSDRLTAQGHRVFAPTLTGVCERSHLGSPSVDLSTQIRDVVNEIRWKDLENVVLVGHSYGGMVISGVAEQVASKIASIVYLDAFPFTAPIPAARFAVNEADRAWVDSKMTPQSTACFTEKIKLTGAYQRIARKAYVRAKNFAGFATTFERIRSDDSWNTWVVDCGHDIMIDKPDELTSILVGLI